MSYLEPARWYSLRVASRPGDQLEVVPAPGGRQATAEVRRFTWDAIGMGIMLDGSGSLQAEVVHDVVGVVVVDLCLDLLSSTSLTFDLTKRRPRLAPSCEPSMRRLAVALAGEFEGNPRRGPADATSPFHFFQHSAYSSAVHS